MKPLTTQKFISALLLLLAIGCSKEPSAPQPAACEPCEPCECSRRQAQEEVAHPAAAPGQDLGKPEIQMPDECILYHLADQYEPTTFSHSNHVGYADDCDTCHHHSSQVEVAPPCRECHGETSGDLRHPGLKGAYHRQCMNCHREQGSGPLDCEGCHKLAQGKKSDTVDQALHSVKDQLLLGHLAQEFGGVLFKHKLHVELTDNCSACHHKEKGVEKTPPCRACHNTREGLKEAYHQQCIRCHQTTSTNHKQRMKELQDEITAAKKDDKKEKERAFSKALERELARGGSPLNCKDCHLPKRAPTTVDLGHVSQIFGPVSFNHESHANLAQFCTDCHHSNKNHGVFQPCKACHGTRDHSEKAQNTPALTAYHKQCIGCHQKDDQGPVDCLDCHAPKNIPDQVSLGAVSQQYLPVDFDHKLHTKSVSGCDKCHHVPQSYQGISSCATCHKANAEANVLAAKDAFHKQCIECHKKDDSGPTDCDDCHTKKQ